MVSAMRFIAALRAWGPQMGRKCLAASHVEMEIRGPSIASSELSDRQLGASSHGYMSRGRKTMTQVSRVAAKEGQWANGSGFRAGLSKLSMT